MSQTVFFGDHAVVIDSPIVAGMIRDSFNRVEKSATDPQIKATLAKLHEAVANLSKRLTPDKAEEAADNLKILTREATSDEPRRRWYELSAEGLKEAANAVVGIGPSVVKAVDALLKLLA